MCSTAPWGVDGSGCKGITLERRIHRSRVGRGTIDRCGRKPRDARFSIVRDVDGHQCRAHRSAREVTVLGWEGGRKTWRQYVPSRKTWILASARAQSSNGELTFFGWEGGPQSVAAIRSIAQHMELRKRKGAKLGKQTERSYPPSGVPGHRDPCAVRCPREGTPPAPSATLKSPL